MNISEQIHEYAGMNSVMSVLVSNIIIKNSSITMDYMLRPCRTKGQAGDGVCDRWR